MEGSLSRSSCIGIYKSKEVHQRRVSAAARLLDWRSRFPPGHGCLSLMNVVRCQVEVSATGRSLVQRSPTECVFVCVIDYYQIQQ